MRPHSLRSFPHRQRQPSFFQKSVRHGYFALRFRLTPMQRQRSTSGFPFFGVTYSTNRIPVSDNGIAGEESSSRDDLPEFSLRKIRPLVKMVALLITHPSPP